MTDEEVKDFLFINVGEYFEYTGEKLYFIGKYFKSRRKNLYFKLSDENNLRKVAGSFHNFLAAHDKVEKYVKLIENTPEAKVVMQSSSSDNCVCHYNINILNLFNSELQLINT